jgi:hypothetical protein
MRHDDAARLLTAGAVLDDLEPDERVAYESHRASCASCRSLEVELEHVMLDLALAVPDRLPPPDLLSAVRAAIASEIAAGDPGGAASPALSEPKVVSLSERRSRSSSSPWRSRMPLAASLGLAAALGIVAVGLGARGMDLQRQVDMSGARVASLEQALAGVDGAMTVAIDPGHVSVPLEAEAQAPAAQAAVVYVPGSSASWIVARDLPATRPGSAYQLWYADEAGVHGLQALAYDGTGMFVAPIDADLGHASAVMVTLEPAGGATGEPGPQVVFGELHPDPGSQPRT